MKNYIFLIFLLALAACNKDKNPNWEVTFEGLSTKGDHLIILNRGYHNKEQPYILETGSGNVIWEEDQVLPASFSSDECNKVLQVEIPNNSITEFYYQDEAIKNNLKCYVFQRYYNAKDGFYRIDKGYIKGEKINGVWNIDFDLKYGGQKHDKYSMVRGAKY